MQQVHTSCLQDSREIHVLSQTQASFYKMPFSRQKVLYLVLLAALMHEARGENENLGDLVSLDEYEMTRTFDSFNSTTLLILIAVGSVLLLGLGVALYLYDYFADTARSEPLPESQYQYTQDAYQNAQYAYPDAQQYYR